MSRNLSDLSVAKLINSTATIRDRVSGSNSGDTFRFDLAQASRFSIKFKSAASGANLKLIHDRNLNGQIDSGEVLQSTRIGTRQKEAALPEMAAGTYYLQVSTRGQGTNRYQLTLNSSAISNNSLPAGNSISIIDQIVGLTNDFRRQNGLPPVTLNPLLTTAAQTQSQNMAQQDYFDHASPTGVTPGHRVSATGYRWSRVAENIGAGQTTAASVVNDWINSPEHRVNMLDAKVTEIGVGYYFLENDTGNGNWNYYWTQVFAAPM